jgi:hypothetical protein
VALAQLLGLLSRRQRDAIVLRYFDDLEIPAIGQVMRISPSSVSVHLRRALQRLGEFLHDEGVIDGSELHEPAISSGSSPLRAPTEDRRLGGDERAIDT